MSEKTNKIKIEKNLLATIALIITIGIATVTPLTFFMTNAKAQADEQWFDINLSYAYFNANTYFNADVDDDLYRVTGAIHFDTLLNFNALNQHDARVEYFEFLLYTDELLLSKTHEYIGVDKLVHEYFTSRHPLLSDDWYNIPWLTEKLGVTFGIGWDSSHPNYSPLSSGGEYKSTVSNRLPEALQGLGTTGRRVSAIDETSNAILAALENTQTIYLDITRVAYINFDDAGTVTTFECDQLIQHIELTKNSNGEFTFGDLPSYVANAFSHLDEMESEHSVGVMVADF